MYEKPQQKQLLHLQQQQQQMKMKMKITTHLLELYAQALEEKQLDAL